MMRDRDRAELREILAKHKLLFLRPKYREEQMIEEDKGLFRLFFIFYDNNKKYIQIWRQKKFINQSKKDAKKTPLLLDCRLVR